MSSEGRESGPQCRDLSWLHRGRHESRTLMMRSVGDRGEGPTTSAKAKRRESTRHVQEPAVHLEAVGLRGSLQVKLGRKTGVRSGRTFSTRLSLGFIPSADGGC